MRQWIFYTTLTMLFLTACNNQQPKQHTNDMTQPVVDTVQSTSGYLDVNGIHMYYEIYGEGRPLVLIHGGGSTIQTTFGRIIPHLAKHRRVIGVELQAHGHTTDRDADLSFEQDADDVAALLAQLNITKADIFGFSNGGTTALYIAARHPNVVHKVIAGSALCKRNGVPPQFWDFMKQATIESMPQQYKDAYRSVAPNPDKLETMGNKCAKRMLEFKDMTDAQLQSIQAPTLIVVGDADVMTPEHAVAIHRLIPNSSLAIIPGGHGEYIGEITTLTDTYKESTLILPLIEGFLDKR